MSYIEERTVLLPDGQWAIEVRTLCPQDGASYRYEWGLRPVDLSRCDVEYNGQVLGAREPEADEREWWAYA